MSGKDHTGGPPRLREDHDSAPVGRVARVARLPSHGLRSLLMPALGAPAEFRAGDGMRGIEIPSATPVVPRAQVYRLLPFHDDLNVSINVEKLDFRVSSRIRSLNLEAERSGQIPRGETTYTVNKGSSVYPIPLLPLRPSSELYFPARRKAFVFGGPLVDVWFVRRSCPSRGHVSRHKISGRSECPKCRLMLHPW